MLYVHVFMHIYSALAMACHLVSSQRAWWLSGSSVGVLKALSGLEMPIARDLPLGPSIDAVWVLRSGNAEQLAYAVCWCAYVKRNGRAQALGLWSSWKQGTIDMGMLKGPGLHSERERVQAAVIHNGSS